MIKGALQSKKANIHKSNNYKSNQIKMLVFEKRGKPEYPEKNLSEQSREPTNSAHLWHQVRESNPGHIGGRRVLNNCANPAPLTYEADCFEKVVDELSALFVNWPRNTDFWPRESLEWHEIEKNGEKKKGVPNLIVLYWWLSHSQTNMTWSCR